MTVLITIDVGEAQVPVLKPMEYQLAGGSLGTFIVCIPLKVPLLKHNIGSCGYNPPYLGSLALLMQHDILRSVQWNTPI